MTSIPADKSIQYFHELTRSQQAAVIRRMASDGWSDHGIACATRLSVQFVRQVIAERSAP